MNGPKARKKRGSTSKQQEQTKSSDLERGLSLDVLAQAGFCYPNVWQAEPVTTVAEKWLDSWWIIKIVKVASHPENFGFHFVGRNIRESEGAVSSKIEKFDPTSMSGVTHSGRVYRLVGLPGSDANAEYVLYHWLKANSACSETATAEFIRQYGISLEHIAKLPH